MSDFRFGEKQDQKTCLVRKTENKRKNKEINEEIGQRNFPELDSNFQMERAWFTKYPVNNTEQIQTTIKY